MGAKGSIKEFVAEKRELCELAMGAVEVAKALGVSSSTACVMCIVIKKPCVKMAWFSL